MTEPVWIADLFTSIDAKETRCFLSFLAPDARFRFGSAPIIAGHEAIGAAVDGFFASIRSSRHLILHTWTEPRTVICQGDVVYTRLDSTQISVPFVNVFSMQGRLIAEYLIYVDIAPLFEP